MKYKRTIATVLYNELEMTLFDRIMYRGNAVLTYTIYQLYIVAGPIDIAKNHMLQYNQSIYGLLVLWMSSIRMTILGLIFDAAVRRILQQDFIFCRLIILGLCTLIVIMLVPLVRLEIYEILRFLGINYDEANDKSQSMLGERIEDHVNGMLRPSFDIYKHEVQ